MSVKSIARDETNDIVVYANDIKMSEGLEACASILKSVILTVSGEVYLNVALGIPYFSTVFESRRNLALWASAVREEVEDLWFVEAIESFDYTALQSSQTLLYSLKVKTTEGESASIEGTIGG